jgi:hypothetical protein
MTNPSFKGVRAPSKNLAHDRLPSQPRRDAFDRRRVFALQMNNTKVAVGIFHRVPSFVTQFLVLHSAYADKLRGRVGVVGKYRAVLIGVAPSLICAGIGHFGIQCADGH